jgi:ectoine hydroxylase-related dioxygenase (phytanoyl-CoA dioxygenase family)
MTRPLREITAEEVAGFEEDGVVCLRGILPPAWLDQMAGVIESVLTHHTSTDLTAMAGRLGNAESNAMTERRGRFIAGTDHWRHLPEFHRFATQSPLPLIAGRLMRASKVNLYEDSVLVKEPGATEATAFHQDLSYFHVEGTQVCTAWCPLDPVTRATGAVGYVRGSHHWGTVYRPNLFVSTASIPDTEGECVPDINAHPERYEILFFDMRPGDISVHHGRTLHGAGGNASVSQRRRAISVRYCGDDVRYRIRPGAPLKAHHARGRDDDVLDSDDCPIVWRA